MDKLIWAIQQEYIEMSRDKAKVTEQEVAQEVPTLY